MGDEMLIRLSLFMLLAACTLNANVYHVTATKGSPPAQGLLQAVPITLEYAATPQQISWGLMKRPFIPDNHGLMIIYPEPTYASIWMFNTYINLSIAFIDNSHVIRQIQDLEAHPEMMDTSRPVNSYWDLSRYGSDSWSARYFHKNRSVSKVMTSYVFEMNMGWFKNNDFKAGDVIFWKPFSSSGFVMHTWDIGGYKPKAERPVLIDLDVQYPVSVWLASTSEWRDVAFVNSDDQVVQVLTLQGGKSQTDLTRAVAYVTVPVNRVLIGTAGSFGTLGLQMGDELKIDVKE